MNARVKKSGWGRAAVLWAAAFGILALSACATPVTSATAPRVATPSATGALLPRNTVIPLSEVQGFFPEISQELATGWNSTASGSPTATRSVAYTNGDGSKKVTISADEYATAADASAGYQKAVELSRAVPDVKAVPVPSLGEQAFAGSVTKDGQTHVGVGVLDGTMVIGATTAGWDATPENIAKLMSLVAAEVAAVKNR
ncbi:hypothetical protein ACFQZ4_44020 [Catellatospora coxensis]|uniref:hypothetical protein n=1 Tax=Catellatospora coxensis TaxID=310354 RepID=UPI00194513D5|nr:hypothetical protein [Catellatospora coxensis]